MGTLKNRLRYSWVEYIPSSVAKTSFCEVLRVDILERLKKASVMEAQSGTRKKPADLVRVPDKFTDLTGRPYTMRDKDADKYLSGSYEKPGVAALGMNALLLKTMDERLFYDELKVALKSGPAKFFASRSEGWHSGFARTLISTQLPSGIAAPRVIPLKNGQWVDSGKEVFFPFGALAVPEGIQVTLVDPAAALNPDRRKLFSKMGVEDMTNEKIRELVDLAHLGTTFKPNLWSPEVLVSHAVFLFRTSEMSDFGEPVSIWMATDMGGCRKSEAMYLPSNVPSSASCLLPRIEDANYGFLHPAYLEIDDVDRALWLEFLWKKFQVSVYPRFFNPRYNSIGPAEINLHNDFRYLMQELEPNAWLGVLRDGWSFYQAWIGGLTHDPCVSNYTFEAKALVKWLSKEYKVSCTGSGGLVPLSETYMPRDNLTAEYGDIAPFLDVPDPDDTRWMPIMETFKIRGEADVDFYVSCLSGAKKNPKTSVETIKKIMHQIENMLEGVNINLNPIR